MITDIMMGFSLGPLVEEKRFPQCKMRFLLHLERLPTFGDDWVLTLKIHPFEPSESCGIEDQENCKVIRCNRI